MIILFTFYDGAAGATGATALGIKCQDNHNDKNTCKLATKNKKYNFRFRPAV